MLFPGLIARLRRAFLVAVAVAAWATSPAATAGSRPLSGPERVLLRLARHCEDAHPTSITVAGRQGPYQAVVAVGKFIATFASPPPGSPTPRGVLLWAIVDSRTDTIGALGLAPTIRAGREAALAALVGRG